MKRILPLLVMLSNWMLLPAQPQDWDQIHAKTERKVKQLLESDSGVLGMAVMDLATGENWVINDQVFPQGSSIKIPILMEVYRQAESGLFSLTDELRITHRDQVGGSGVLGEFGDGTSSLSIRDLAILMIALSDNTATNILIDLVGMDRVNSSLRGMGLEKTLLQRKMMDAGARARGDENISTPREAMRIMELLYRGDFLNSELSRDILSILRKYKPGDIRAGLPANVSVAFKPGGIPGVVVEWAIVEYEPRPFILVIMGKLGVVEELSQTITGVAQEWFQYFERLGTSTRFGTYVDPILLKKKP